MHRRGERGVREWKRAQAAALDDAARAKAGAKVREWQKRLKDHIDKNDLKRLPYRESITIRSTGPSSRRPRPDGEPSTPPRSTPSSPATPDLDRPGAAIASMPNTRSAVGRAAVRTFDLIGQVHQIPTGAAKVPLKAVSTKRYLGQYRYLPGGKPVDLSIATGRPDLEGTIAHEFGHYLDQRVLGTAGSELTSAPDGPMRRVFDAITQTKTHAELQSTGDAYLLHPAEVWARASGQWIATRTADAEMLDAIAQLRALPASSADRVSQWTAIEFGPSRKRSMA